MTRRPRAGDVKIAEDRAEQLKRDPDKVIQELDKRLREDLRRMGDFSRIHPLPRSGADVPDDMDARLVVLSAEHAYTKDAENSAEAAAKAILGIGRGLTCRDLFRQHACVSTLADKVRLQDLDEALRKYLAWASILSERESLNLSPFPVGSRPKHKASGGRSRDRTIAGSLPMVARARAGQPAIASSLVHQEFRQRRPCRASQQNFAAMNC